MSLFNNNSGLIIKILFALLKTCLILFSCGQERATETVKTTHTTRTVMPTATTVMAIELMVGLCRIGTTAEKYQKRVITV